MSQASFVLKTQSADRPGIIAMLSSAIFQSGGNVADAQQFADPVSNQFFSRIVIDIDAARTEALRASLATAAAAFGITYSLTDHDHRPKVLILASRYDHCLGELLYQTRSGDLRMQVVGLVSNYTQDIYGNVVGVQDVPFYHCPITAETKPQQERQILDIVDRTAADLVVLARYMQILSDDLASRLSGRCINIHHSFLPGFKGAKPYHQAYDRGVKLIGATAHYVTADLDEGPIIEQDVERVSHHHTPEMLVRKGREIERRVLARAVRYHVEERVILNGHRTVVFPD